MMEENERRWILVPILGSDPVPGKGFRAAVVYENERGYYPTGQVSNQPGSQPPLYFPGDTIEEAEALAEKWNEARGVSKAEYERILGGSMGSPEITVVYDGDDDSYSILADDEEVLHLEWDDTTALVAALCRKLGWDVPAEYDGDFDEEEDAEDD